MPESRTEPISGLGKSVLLGGGAAGILSVFPVVNLLNLFFMLWIALGAALTVYLLAKENPGLGRGDAFLAGCLSGLVAGAMFASLSLLTVLGISQEKLEALLDKAKTLAPLLDADMTRTLQSGQFKAMMLLSIGLFVFMAIVAGGIAGLIARKFFGRPAEPPHG